MKHLSFWLFLMVLLTPGFAQEAKHLDLIKLNNDALLEGVISNRTINHITLETLGGRVILPKSAIVKMVEAKPGESELVLGIQLIEREDFKRAEFFLDKASRYSNWHRAAKNQLEALQDKKRQAEQQQRQQQQREIERLIQSKGLKAGVEALQRQSRAQNNEAYWGHYRGKIHLLMARERLDHLDVNGAERHLQLAEKYGSDPKEWNKVRQEIIDYRSSTMIFNRKTLLARRHESRPQPTPPPNPQIPSNWLATVNQDRTAGKNLPPKRWLEWVNRYSQMNGLDPLLVWAMIDVESSWRKNVVSHAGAQGLMQLMPETAVDMQVANPFDPEQNIKGGTKYMRFLLEIFNDTDEALAAYNIGPGRLERAGKITQAGQRYVKKVRSRYQTLRQEYAQGDATAAAGDSS